MPLYVLFPSSFILSFYTTELDWPNYLSTAAIRINVKDMHAIQLSFAMSLIFLSLLWVYFVLQYRLHIQLQE